VGSLTQQPAETLSIDPGSVITSAGAIRLSGRLALSALAAVPFVLLAAAAAVVLARRRQAAGPAA
jgi:hypothetical protein